MKFNCPHCNQRIEAPDDWAGTQGNCPECANLITLPQPDSSPPSDEEASTLPATATPQTKKAYPTRSFRSPATAKPPLPLPQKTSIWFRLLQVAVSLGTGCIAAYLYWSFVVVPELQELRTRTTNAIGTQDLNDLIRQSENEERAVLVRGSHGTLVRFAWATLACGAVFFVTSYAVPRFKAKPTQ